MDILIVHKDKKTAAVWQDMVSQVSDNIESIQICHSAKEAITYLNENDNPDIIIIDTAVSKSGGFDIVDKSDSPSTLVFVAENDAFALDSFKYNTLDYIILPITEARVKQTAEKYLRYYKKQSEVGYLKDLQTLMSFVGKQDKDYKKRFMVKIGNVIKSVAVEDIAYFFAHERIIYLVDFKGKKLPIDYTLDEVEKMLDPEVFKRANRQFIVGINAIAEIHPYFKGRIKINLNPQQEGDIVISSEKSRSFKEWLDE